MIKGPFMYDENDRSEFIKYYEVTIKVYSKRYIHWNIAKKKNPIYTNKSPWF